MRRDYGVRFSARYLATGKAAMPETCRPSATASSDLGACHDRRGVNCQTSLDTAPNPRSALAAGLALGDRLRPDTERISAQLFCVVSWIWRHHRGRRVSGDRALVHMIGVTVFITGPSAGTGHWQTSMGQ